jgi:hypothetical protein
MSKKIIAFLSVVAFASTASVSLACGTSCGDKKDKDDAGDTSLTSFVVEGGGCGGGGCKRDKDADRQP